MRDEEQVTTAKQGPGGVWPQQSAAAATPHAYTTRTARMGVHIQPSNDQEKCFDSTLNIPNVRRVQSTTAVSRGTSITCHHGRKLLLGDQLAQMLDEATLPGVEKSDFNEFKFIQHNRITSGFLKVR